MESNETLRKMRDMRLTGMADAFSEQISNRIGYTEFDAETRIGMLVDAELDRRQSVKLTNLIRAAKLRNPEAQASSVIYEPGRCLDKATIMRYFTCQYITDKINLVITGPTSSGKTWLSCALLMSACRHYHTARYTRMPELLDELQAAKKAGFYERVVKKYAKFECLVIDEFMLNATTKEETRDLYELLEKRDGTTSTIFCSQYQEAGWLERLGGGTSGESIVDRISNNTYRIALSGDMNMREYTTRVGQ